MYGIILCMCLYMIETYTSKIEEERGRKECVLCVCVGGGGGGGGGACVSGEGERRVQLGKSDRMFMDYLRYMYPCTCVVSL